MSVFSTRMDDETAALVQRLVGEARVACGSDVPKFLTAVKVRVLVLFTPPRVHDQLRRHA